MLFAAVKTIGFFRLTSVALLVFSAWYSPISFLFGSEALETASIVGYPDVEEGHTATNICGGRFALLVEPNIFTIKSFSSYELNASDLKERSVFLVWLDFILL